MRLIKQPLASMSIIRSFHHVSAHARSQSAFEKIPGQRATNRYPRRGHTHVDPSGAELAYDDESGAVTLLLTVDGSADLYMLDLQTEYWNIGDLGAVPSSISSNPAIESQRSFPLRVNRSIQFEHL